VDALAELLDGVRARGALFGRSVMDRRDRCGSKVMRR
jgi:hypothetical protein